MHAPIDFDALYGIDLVYRPGCWQLCGDAHCCSFARVKSSFRFLYRTPGQELPLLPGEYDWLKARSLHLQFGDHQHRALPYRFGDRTMTIESVLSRRPGCACDHATRTTVCRLYPFLPVLDVDGRFTGVQRLGMFDMLEELDGRERACRVDEIPREELGKLLAMAGVLAAHPLALFCTIAYRLAHEHLRERLQTLRQGRDATVFAVMESAFARRTLIDPSLERTMIELADRIEDRFGVELFPRATAG